MLAEDTLHSVRMVACGEDGGGQGEWGGSEVLHLVRVQFHASCLVREFFHVLKSATGVRGDKVWYQLLFQSGFPVDAIEDAFELVQ